MRHRWIMVIGVATLALAACGTASGVRSGDAQETGGASDLNEPARPDPPDTTELEPPDTTEPEPPDTTEPEPPDTTEPEPPDTTPTSTLVVPEGPTFEFADKPEQPYDDYLAGAINDVQRFWRATFPAIYGEEYEELAGGVFPVYPGRRDVPGGCGMRRTTYRDVQGNAFYCGEGDFIAYDDDDLFPTIHDEIGQFALAVVMAHEWGHAVQARAEFDARTLLLEQQADCFAGAWARWIADGNGINVTFAEEDLNAAINGLIAVRDEPGEVSSNPNAHGSAFDRVGAFQEGWFDGAGRCRDFDTDAPPSTLLPFTDGDFTTGGNAPYNEIVELLQTALDDVWSAALTDAGVAFTAPAVDLGGDDTAARCSDVPDDALRIAFYCAPTNTIVASDERLRDLYERFGDNAVGILIANAYSEAVQQAMESALRGEARALVSDCLTGFWTSELFPEPGVDKVSISAGDLDEGIQTLVAIGDPTSDTDELGSPFEKIDAFRTGVLEGLGACQFQMTS
jgi:predicted metalloprotease